MSAHTFKTHTVTKSLFHLNTILLARAKVILLIILFLCNQCTAVVK